VVVVHRRTGDQGDLLGYSHLDVWGDG